MRKKLLTFIGVFFLQLLLFSMIAHGADFIISENKTLRSSDLDLRNGRYRVEGDFTIQPGGQLILDTSIILEVTGDINIKGNLISRNGNYDIYLYSTEGNINIESAITITGQQGQNGREGDKTRNGSSGSKGLSSDLAITAKTGDIFVNAKIENVGGKGGTGGKGGPSDGEDAGNGGSGGNGGNGGEILLVAEKGKVVVGHLISSTGGKGGTGGEGGPDATPWGGPGNGGRGGTGGSGGIITLVGQDVIITPIGQEVIVGISVLNINGGEPGSGGAGGDHGSFGNNGPDGSDGNRGSAGSVNVAAGMVYQDTQQITDLDDIITNPSSASKELRYDTVPPSFPADVIFDNPQYNDTYFAGELATIKVPLFEDHGLLLDDIEQIYDGGFNIDPGIELKSGLGRIRVYSDESFNAGMVFPLKVRVLGVIEEIDPQNIDDNYHLISFNSSALTIPGEDMKVFKPYPHYDYLRLVYHLNIAVEDKNSNESSMANNVDEYYKFSFDPDAPSAPATLPLSLAGDTTLQFSWTPPEDRSGIRDYDIWLNDELIEENYPDSTFTYDVGYNKEAHFKVLARDSVGNESTFSEIQTYYTVPRESRILSVQAQYDPTWSEHRATVNFENLGDEASGYEIKCYEVTSTGERIYPEGQYERIKTKSGSDHVTVFDQLTPHKYYKFEIRTVNGNVEEPSYSNWITYGPIRMANSQPSKAQPIFPDNAQMFNRRNFATLVLKSTQSFDVDNDELTYILFINGEEQVNEQGILGDNSVTFNPQLPDGTYTWFVRTRDPYGGETVDESSRTVTLDQTAPGIPSFSVAHSAINSTSVQLNDISISPNDSDVEKIKIWSDQGGESLSVDLDRITNSSYLFTIPNIQDKHTINMKAVDAVGNESMESYQVDVIYDLTAPHKPANITVASGVQSLVVDWADSTDLLPVAGVETSGVEKYKIRYREAGVQSWMSEQEVSISRKAITGLADNTEYQIQIKSIDYAGNESDWTTTTSRYTKPSAGSLQLVKTDYLQVEFGDYQHYVEFTVDPGESEQYRIIRQRLVNGQLTGDEVRTEWLNSSQLTYIDDRDILPYPTGIYQYKIETRNTDESGTQASGPITVTVENNLPDQPINNLSGFTQQLRPSLGSSPVSDPDGHGLTYYFYVEEEDETGARNPLVSWLAANHPGGVYQPEVDLVDGYTYYYRVGVVEDHQREAFEAGDRTVGVISNETCFTVDRTPPQIIISIPEEIKGSVDNGDPVASATVTVSAMDQNPVRMNGLASGLGSDGLTIYFDENDADTQIIPSGSQVTMEDGLHTLYVMAQDNAGNMTQIPAELTVKVDQSAPEILAFDLSALPVEGTNYTTNGTELYATFTLQDLESGITKVEYAVVSDQAMNDIDSLPGDYWQPMALQTGVQTHYSIRAPFSMEEGMGYYLLLRATNGVGRESSYQSDRVVVDTTGPEITFSDSRGTMPNMYRISSLADLTLKVDVTDVASSTVTTEYSLVEGRQESQMINPVSNLTQLSETSLADGTVYYLAVRGSDLVGHTSVAYSVPILYDQTSSVIETVRGGKLNPISEAIQPQWDTSQLNLYWKINDEVSINQIRYAIGTQEGGREISEQLPGNVQGWLTADSINKEDNLIIDGLNLADGYYYMTMEVTNEVGLISILSSKNPVQVNSSLPPTPVVTDDGIYSQFDEIHFTVFYPTEELIGQSYYYQIIDESKSVLYQSELINPDQLVNVSVSVSGADGLVLTSNQTYYVQLGKIVNGQFSAISYSDGVQIDSTAPTFNYLEDGTYFHPQEIKITWEAQDNQSGIANYAIKVGTTRGGDELTNGWVSMGAQTSTTLPDLTLPAGEVFYVTVKAMNGAGQVTQIMGDGFEVDHTAPTVPLVLRDSTYTNDLTTLSASWLWLETGLEADSGSGVREYFYDILEVRDGSLAEWKPVKNITGDALSQSAIFSDLNLINGTTYYIAIKAVDGVGLSAIGLSEGILVDTQAPDLPSIDQLREYQSFTDQLTAQFISQDDESGLDGFRYSIETLDGDTVVDWNNLHQTATTVTNLSLSEGQVYLFAAQAFDHAGLYSLENRSDGVMVDSHLPVIDSVSSDRDYVTDAEQIFFQWQSSYIYTPIVEYEYALGRSEQPTSYNWKSTLQQQIALSPEEVDLPAFEADGRPYYFFVRAKDRFGRYSEIKRTSVVIDSTPPDRPVILSNGEYQSNQLVLSWESNDQESKIAGYQYAVGTQRGLTDVTGGWVTVVSTDQQVQVERDDLILEHNQRYYLVVKVRNNAGDWSEIGYDGGFLVDLYQPEVTGVVGPEKYHNNQSQIENLEFSAQDDEVGLKAYRYQLVLAEEQSEITELSTASIPLEQVNGNYPKTVTQGFDATGLSLVEGESYYIAVQTQNILNMWSSVVFTEASFVVDATPPMISFAKENEEIVVNIEDDSIGVEWNTNEPGTAYYRLKLPNGNYLPASGYSAENVISTELQRITFDQSSPGTYRLELYMVDEAGNECELITQQIRVNAPPTIKALNPIAVYKGRELIPTSANFEINDSDGRIVNYQWDFGDQTPEENSTELSHAHAYQDTGSYTLTLTVTDQDGATATATLNVIVTNTLGGALHLDEVWSGTIVLKDEIIVPEGILLTIEPGTTVIVPMGKGIRVDGTIDINGGLAGEVLFTTVEPSGLYGPNLWKGIYVSELGANSQFINTTIQYAERGLTLNGQMIQINYCTFSENGIGVHLQDSSPVIQNSSFESNLYYGIKEEANCDPTLNTNTFMKNGLAPYYDDEKTLLTLEEINALLGYGNE